MHDHEETIKLTGDRFAEAGRRHRVPFGVDWLAIIQLVLALFKDCGADAVRRTPLAARIRLTRDLRQAMPGASLREIAAVREAVMEVASVATDEELVAFGSIEL